MSNVKLFCFILAYGCVDYGFDCSYDREQRPRGRASTKRTRVDSPPNDTQPVAHQLAVSSSTGLSAGFALNAASHEAQPTRQQVPSNSRSDSIHQEQSLNAAEGRQSSSFNSTEELHNPRPIHQTYAEYLQVQQDLAGTPSYQSFFFDDGSLNNFSHLDFYGNGLQGMPATIYSASGNDSNQNNDQDTRTRPGDRPSRTISRIGFVVPNTPHYRPQSAFVKSADGPTACRYPVLKNFMQHISHIISPAIACHLLDLYFAEPSSSLFESASPYVLSKFTALAMAISSVFTAREEHPFRLTTHPSSHISQEILFAPHEPKKDIAGTARRHFMGYCTDFRCFSLQDSTHF